MKISTRLVQTPMALVANQYGYSGNMERITRAQAYQKSGGDSMSNYYFGQKKILEVNPGHPLIKEMLRRVEADSSDKRAKDLAQLMFESATLRSGYELPNMAAFADRIESMMRSAMNISPDEKIDEEPDFEEPEEVVAKTGDDDNEVKADEEDKGEVNI